MMHLQRVCLLDLLGLLCLLLVHFIAPQGAGNGDWQHLEICKHEPVAVAAILKIIIMQVILNLGKQKSKYLYIPFMLKRRKKLYHIAMTPMVPILTMVNVLMYSASVSEALEP